ncbi:hypothetical protein ACFQ0D_30260, partial [Micromonospora zhanjiangensis]
MSPFAAQQGGKPRAMSGKQMEGDNQRRRALARQARQRGDRASRSGATLGSAKQVEHRSEKH